MKFKRGDVVKFSSKGMDDYNKGETIGVLPLVHRRFGIVLEPATKDDGYKLNIVLVGLDECYFFNDELDKV